MKNLDHWLENPEFARLSGIRKKAGVQGAARKVVDAPKRSKPRRVLPPPKREGDVITITLPLPDGRLANAANNLHWATKSRLVKDARETAAIVARIVAPQFVWERARMDVESWTARHIDPSNWWNYLKGTIDGLQDARLFLNDSALECGTITQHVGKLAEGKRELVVVVTKVK